jgi:hypothetical protein
MNLLVNGLSVKDRAIAKNESLGERANQLSPVSALAVARGTARCASQVLDRGAQAAASLCAAGT